MILNYSWAVWLAWMLGLFFIVNGALNVVGFRPMKESLVRWGLPVWFHLVNGAVQIALGAMILWYPTRVLGLLLAALLCVAIWIVLTRNREWRHLAPSAVLFAIVVVDAWGLRLI